MSMVTLFLKKKETRSKTAPQPEITEESPANRNTWQITLSFQHHPLSLSASGRSGCFIMSPGSLEKRPASTSSYEGGACRKQRIYKLTTCGGRGPVWACRFAIFQRATPVVRRCIHIKSITRNVNPMAKDCWEFTRPPHDFWDETSPPASGTHQLHDWDARSPPSTPSDVQYHQVRNEDQFRVGFIWEILNVKHGQLEVSGFTEKKLELILENLCTS